MDRINNKSSLYSAVSLWIGICFAFAVWSSPIITEASNRSVQNINIGWKFANTPNGNPQDSAYDDASWKSVSLPYPLMFTTSHLNGSTDCNNQQTFDRSSGWYRRHFSLQNQKGKKVFVVFQTVMQVATVYVNGKLVGKHERSGYDSFHFDISNYCGSTGDNVIAVKVDNSINANSPPDDQYASCVSFPEGMDFILFGGINGDVFLVCTDQVHVGFQWESTNSGITITTPNPSTSSATVNIQAFVKNESTVNKNIVVVATIVDANNAVVGVPVTSTLQSISANGVATFSLSAMVQNPKLWDCDNPNLYKLYLSVRDGATPVDSVWTRFGIRSFSWSATTGFSLNGNRVKLIGVNRHSAWPFVGGAIPNTVHKREAQQIKDCGFNWIRLSHYPHDPDFLDAMDELGLLGVEEPPTWAHTGNTTWMTNLYETFRREIRRDKNHACIMSWNTNINHFNCESTLQGIAKSEDASRTAGCTNGSLSNGYIPTPHCFEAYDSANDVPVMVGNGGYCQEHTGHTWRSTRFFTTSWTTEQRQLIHCRKHWEEVGSARATTSNAGLAAWVMYDYNTFHGSGFEGTAGTLANGRNIAYHGLFDIFRIPKFAAYWYTSELTSTPMAFIANYWMANQPQHDTVTVFSNCDKVELFVNGISKGNKTPDKGNNYRASLKHPPFFFTGITYEAGTLVALGSNNGLVVVRDTIRTPQAAAKLTIETDVKTLVADGADFCRIIVSVCDANGTVIPTASPAITLSASGAGSVISENPINAEAGKIVFLVRAGLVAGNISVKATSGSLMSASVTVPVAGLLDSTGTIQYSQHYLVGVNTQMSPTYELLYGNHYMLSPKYATAIQAIEFYSVDGKMLHRALVDNKKSIDISFTRKNSGLFIVKLLPK